MGNEDKNISLLSTNEEGLTDNFDGNSQILVTKDGGLVDLVFAVSGGLVTLSIYFIMLAEMLNYLTTYEGREYNFHVIIPQYFAIPFNFVVSMMLNKASLKLKVLLGSILTLVFGVAIPVVTILLNKELSGYLIMMTVYFIAYTWSVFLSGQLTACISYYPPKYGIIFFTAQPCFNLLIMIFKTVFVQLEISLTIDLAILWGLFVLCIFALIISFLIIDAQGRFQSQSSKISDTESGFSVTEEVAKASYLEVIKEFFSELSSIFSQLFVTFLIFPGVFLAMTPKGFAANDYINNINLISAICDVAGRPMAAKPYNRVLIQITLVISILLTIFICSEYALGWYKDYSFMGYATYGIVAFTMLRTSTAITYLIVSANIKASERNQGVIGVLMTLSLIGGIASGNLVSMGFNYIVKTVL